MFSKIISFFMSALMFIASLLGFNVSKDAKDMITYNPTETAVSVSVSENASTGYKWQYKIADEKIAVLSEDEYIYTAPAGMVGAAGTRIYTFKGVSEGSTYITLKYVREWEPVPARTIVIKLTVNANKTLLAALISDT